MSVTIVGAGLAGSECAWQLARRGVAVRLVEMRPTTSTAAHRTADFAELVCSNSLRSDEENHPAGVLKREMERLGSLVIAAARATAVPAGGALAVERDRFSALITATLAAHPLIEIVRAEVIEIPAGDVVLATGPLTSPGLSQVLVELLGAEHLAFYDAIAPIVDAESLDYTKLFWASRWGKGSGDDYLNAALDEDAYVAFHRAITEAEVLPLRDFEANLFFEGCLPIEELARRGLDTLRFGPMKPVGLATPDGKRPWAVVQLRREDLATTQFNMVGFQSRMKWGDQQRVLRMIPGLEQAEFVRLGQIHRNTFINAPTHLDERYRLRQRPNVRLAGQITGVEGYLESAATGLAVGLDIARERSGLSPAPFPAETAFGALLRHLTESDPRRFQPANINYGLFAPVLGRIKKADRRIVYATRAVASFTAWASDWAVGLDVVSSAALPPPQAPTAAAVACAP